MEPPITNHQSPITGVESPITGVGDQSPITSHQSPGDDEISLLDLAIVLAKFKWLILGLPLVAAILAVVHARQLPDIYTAAVKLLPPQSQSATVTLGGALASLGGGAATPYIGMLKSRTVADGIIQRLDLNTLFHQKLQSGTRAVLGGMTSIKSDKDGMFVIEVDSEDPKLAAVLANAYADELYKLTNVLALTAASRRSLFYARQLVLAKDNLNKAEAAVKQSLEKGGLIEVTGQGQAILGAIGRLRGEISVKEVQIGFMRTFAAERNPELLRAQQELEVMKRKLATLENGEGAKLKENSAANTSQGIENLRLYRDLKYYETIYDMLTNQYKLSKVEEAKDSAVIQVLDKAVEPDSPSKPNRRNIVLSWAVGAGLFAIILAFIIEAGQRTRQNPQQAERLNLLRRYLWGK